VEGDSIETAFNEFVTALQSEDFFTTDEGWPAELIGAYVASSNDYLANITEHVARSEQQGGGVSAERLADKLLYVGD
jgi:hypothetical protein